MPGPAIATETDPQGRPVVLDAVGWAHIFAEHREMAGHQAAAMLTVAQPDHVGPDPRAGRVRHYRRGVGPSRWLLVVIDFG